MAYDTHSVSVTDTCKPFQATTNQAYHGPLTNEDGCGWYCHPRAGNLLRGEGGGGGEGGKRRLSQPSAPFHETLQFASETIMIMHTAPFLAPNVEPSDTSKRR